MTDRQRLQSSGVFLISFPRRCRMSLRKTHLEAWLETGPNCLLAKNVAGWVHHWADEGRIEFPFAPAGYVEKVEGKTAIAEYMSSLPAKFDFRHFDVLLAYSDATGQQAVVEFTCDGTVIETGRPYNQHYVALLTFDANGKILVYRDFWNPLLAIEAFGGAHTFINSINEGTN
jgi:ketosteroid isomerase-like protein